MLCKKSLNITSLGYGQQTVKMHVCLVKTGFSPLLDPLSRRQEAHLFQNTNLHILLTTQKQFFLAKDGWGMSVTVCFLWWWMGAKQRTQTSSFCATLFKSFQKLCFSMPKEGILWESVFVGGRVVFKSFLSCVSHLLSVASSSSEKNGVTPFWVAKYTISSHYRNSHFFRPWQNSASVRVLVI